MFGAQIFASLFHPLAKTQLWSVIYHMKAHMRKIQNRYLWLAKHENGCNLKPKNRIGFIIGGLVDENIPEGLMEPDFLFGCHGNR